MSAWIAALAASLGASGFYLRRKRKPHYVSIRMQTLEHRWACQTE